MSQVPLLFLSFINALKKELGYSIGIDKYKAFVTAFAQGQVPVYDYEQFSRFCRILFLSNERDREKFQKLLDELIQADLDLLLRKSEHETSTDTPKETRRPENPLSNPEPRGIPYFGLDDTVPPTPPEPPPEKVHTMTRYFNVNNIPGFSDAQPDSSVDQEKSSVVSSLRYIHTDEYLPISRRQMIKTWHFLRREENAGNSDVIDIPGTVRKIAENGIFLEPVFRNGRANRIKTLAIFADCRGSMSPFSALTQRLIHTARNEGGLKDTAVYYFQNFPLKYVYQTPELLRPLKIENIMRQANPSFTVAMIISDAGAARGNYVPMRIEAVLGRASKTPKDPPGFLELLRQHFAQVVWLNPMPRERWIGTSAEQVAVAMEGNMYPVFEKGEFDFQLVIKAMMGRKETKT